jgi:hypothetical protein
MALTKITSGVISQEFQAGQTLAASGTIDIDWNSAQVFNLTPNQNTTFTFSDYKIGMVKIIVIIGTGGSKTLNFPTTADILGGEYDDGNGVKNFVQIVCTDDSSTPQFFYTISQPS